ncbi:hypothetical protein [Stenotrophomonas sp.]|uniref:hypothetical protein n=1 Tax=Stenotrophomonas sp. TaxID=69392 RepID=UPI002899D313|nr:hypothetical protein [Stenotrophomonas sp.]
MQLEEKRHRDWTTEEISAISIEIGALKGALIDAGILTSEQLNAALVRQRAIAKEAEPQSFPLSVAEVTRRFREMLRDSPAEPLSSRPGSSETAPAPPSEGS